MTLTSNVEAGRARMPDNCEIFIVLGQLGRVNHLATCQEDELVKYCNNVASWSFGRETRDLMMLKAL